MSAPDKTALATIAIDAILHVCEDDAIALLHAVEAAIHRSANINADRRAIVVEELHALQVYMADELEAESEWKGVFA